MKKQIIDDQKTDTMKCTNTQINALLTAYLDKELTPEERKMVEAHLNDCSDCLDELQEIRILQLQTEHIPLINPPEDAEIRFRQILEKQHKPQKQSITITVDFSWKKIAAAVIIFLAGAATTLLFQNNTDSDTSSIERLENQVSQMRQVLMTALIKNDSPSDRLKAVQYAEQISGPSPEVTNILLETLNHDPSVNVRLAAANALQQFAVHQEVRTELAQSLRQQSDPMLQIVLIKMLVQFHEQSMVPTLQDFSHDDNTHEMVKKEAEEALTVLL